jgi:hypothetical protein
MSGHVGSQLELFQVYVLVGKPRNVLSFFFRSLQKKVSMYAK